MRKTISLGDKSTDTVIWQAIVGGLRKDGHFGNKTHDATVRWQRDNSLTPDGIVGPMTWSKAIQLVQDTLNYIIGNG